VVTTFTSGNVFMDLGRIYFGLNNCSSVN